MHHAAATDRFTGTARESESPTSMGHRADPDGPADALPDPTRVRAATRSPRAPAQDAARTVTVGSTGTPGPIVDVTVMERTYAPFAAAGLLR